MSAATLWAAFLFYSRNARRGQGLHRNKGKSSRSLFAASFDSFGQIVELGRNLAEDFLRDGVTHDALGDKDAVHDKAATVMVPDSAVLTLAIVTLH